MDISGQPSEAQEICPKRQGKGYGNIFRYAPLLFSLIMLMVTLNPPTSVWPIDLDVFGYQTNGNIFYWLFMIGIVAYIPFMTGGAILFVHDFILLLKSRRRYHAVNPAVLSARIFIALYRFNGWVSGRIS